ncbi:MAG: hypothetical protein QXQ87_07515, partial [Halobacteria archaeon]
PSPTPSPATPAPTPPSRTPGPPGELLARHARTIDDAVDHALRERPVRLDILAFLKWLNDVRPRSGVPEAVERGYHALRDPTDRTTLQAYLRILNESHREPGDPCALRPTASWDCIVLRGLYCDLQEPPPGHLARAEDMGRGVGYTATHVFLGLLLLRERGCLDRAEVEEAIGRLGDSIAAETASRLARGAVHWDLFAEQVHFLLKAGLCGKVRVEWVESLADRLESRIRYMNPVSPDFHNANPHEVLQEALVVLLWERCLASAPRSP